MSDEPTIIDGVGTKIWKNSNDKFHRDNDLPAIIASRGYCQWYQNGKWHRDNDLPAEIFPNGYCARYKNDKFIKKRICTQEEIEEFKKPYYLQKPKKNIKFNRFERLIK